MFSSGARRSSLRPKTPGRTPGPSRFGVAGPSTERATPSEAPQRFMDAEKLSSGPGSLTRATGQRTSSDGKPLRSGRLVSNNVDDDSQQMQTEFADDRRAAGSYNVGDGYPTNPSPNNPADSILFRRSDGHQEMDHGTAVNLQNTLETRKRSAEQNRAFFHDATYETPGGVAASTVELHVRESRSIRPRTAANEAAETHVVRREEVNAEQALMAVSERTEEEVWRRFRGGGSLDEETLMRREKEELQRTLEHVQKELADYRYNLGVLILEHKTCAPQIEELEEALQRTQEELQKEGRRLRQALDEANRREDALRASLKNERAAIADLRRSLEEMHSKLQTEEQSSRERLAEAEKLRNAGTRELVRAEELSAKASQDLKEALRLEEELKTRESEMDGKLRGLHEKEEEVATREGALRKGEAELKTAEKELREREFAVADKRKKTEVEVEERRKQVEEEIERMKVEAEAKAAELKEEAAREQQSRVQVVLKQREAMLKEIQDLKEAAELDLSARENAVAAKEESAADKEKVVQASLTDLEEKEGALTARQREVENRERFLGEEKREMLRLEAELSEQEKALEEERTRLADQEQEWRRIEAKIEARLAELDARDAAMLSRESAAESALAAANANVTAAQQMKAACDERETALKESVERAKQRQTEIDEERSKWEKERADLEKGREADRQERSETAKRAEELESRAVALEEKEGQVAKRERQLQALDRDLIGREQALATREQEVMLRASGTDEDLNRRWEELDTYRRTAEADVAKQLQLLRADQVKADAAVQKTRVQLEQERAAVEKELQETRAALETEYQAKIEKIEAKLQQKMAVSDAEKQKVVDREVKRRVGELNQELEVKLEERAAKAREEIGGEVEKKVAVQVMARATELEERSKAEVERQVKERVRREVENQVKARVKEAMERSQVEVEKQVEERVKRELEGVVKGRVNDAVEKTREEARVKFEGDKEAAVKKAVKEAERKAESERRAAIESAVREERSRLDGVKRAAIENAGNKVCRAFGRGEEAAVQTDKGLGGGLVEVSQLDLVGGATESTQAVPRQGRGWLGLLSPRRAVKPSNLFGRSPVLPEDASNLGLASGSQGVENGPLSRNPAEATRAPNAEALEAPSENGLVDQTEPVHTEPSPVEAPGVMKGKVSPKPPKPQGKRKQREPVSEEPVEERPLKQRKAVKDAGLDNPDLVGQRSSPGKGAKGGGSVEALGAAVTAVGRVADAVTGPFGFVLDDTDLGFVPGSTTEKAEPERGVKKHRWSLWPGFLSPRKGKPESGRQGEGETTPLEGVNADGSVPVGRIEGQSSPLQEELGASNGTGMEDAAQRGKLRPEGEKTSPEINLMASDGQEHRVLREQPLSAKTPNTRAGRQASKPSKPPLSAVRASGRLREQTLSADPVSVLELPGEIEPSRLPEISGSGPALEVPGQEGARTDSPEDSLGVPPLNEEQEVSANPSPNHPVNPAINPMTAEEQGKVDRIMARLEADERAIALDVAAMEVAAEPKLSVEEAASQGIEAAAHNPGFEAAENLVEEARNTETPGPKKRKKLQLKRLRGEGANPIRLGGSMMLKGKGLGGASGSPSSIDETLLTEAAMAKQQELPDEEDEEMPLSEAGALGVASGAPFELDGGTLNPDSPFVAPNALPPKTPKSAFGRAYENLRAVWGFTGGSSSGAPSQESEEGSLEEEGAYKGGVRSIVGDLVDAADREGGPERLEFGTPEGSQFDGAEGGAVELDLEPPAAVEMEQEMEEEVLEEGGFTSLTKETLFETGDALAKGVEGVLGQGQEIGGKAVIKARKVAIDLNEEAAELADSVMGLSAADMADDVIALGETLRAAETTAGTKTTGVAESLTGNIGEALRDEMANGGLVHTAEDAGNWLAGSAMGIGTSLTQRGRGSLKVLEEGGGSALGRGISRGSILDAAEEGSVLEKQGGRPTRSGSARGVKLQAKVGGPSGEERRGSKRKAAGKEKVSGKEAKLTDSETEEEEKGNRVKRRVKRAGSGEDSELVDPRVVEFAAKFGGGDEGDEGTAERGRKRSRVLVDSRDGEDVSAGIKRYNLRKSTLVKMHVWEPRGADFTTATGADAEGIHTRTGAMSTPRNLQRSAFGGDNPFLEDIAPGNPHCLEDMQRPKSPMGRGRGTEGSAGGPAARDEEADQANAGWRWLGFLGW